ncbi:MAG TPA: methyltransferase, partial [Cupriavidus sp.]|nr:methyltransferase [Cupriavidus sp.]
AGVIMREEGNVRGLNTAATLWGSAAVGACAGADLILEAGIGALFVLAANTMLRPVADRINRQPMDTPAVEVTHTVHVITLREYQKTAMRLLEDALEAAQYPTRDLEVRAFGDQDVEIEAALVATSVDGDALDAIVARLGGTSVVSQAFWSASTTE